MHPTGRDKPPPVQHLLSHQQPPLRARLASRLRAGRDAWGRAALSPLMLLLPVPPLLLPRRWTGKRLSSLGCHNGSSGQRRRVGSERRPAPPAPNAAMPPTQRLLQVPWRMRRHVIIGQHRAALRTRRPTCASEGVRVRRCATRRPTIILYLLHMPPLPLLSHRTWTVPCPSSRGWGFLP